jgi:hypothetical protein
MATAWGYAAPLEAIRYAAANHLLVDLGYQGTTRAIEPYSLRRTKADELVLYAVKSSTGEIRAYRVDRIQSATVTREPFSPRFLIELTHARPISAPSVSTGRPPTVRLGVPRRSPFTRPQQSRSTRRGSASFGTVKHVFECPVCHKRFTRSAYDATLNPHKNKTGWDCFGSVGIYRGTKG